MLGGGGGGHYMKNKNIGGMCFVNSTCPNAKMHKKCKKLSNIENFFLAHFVPLAFYKIHISGAANRQFNMQNMFCFLFSKQSS